MSTANESPSPGAVINTPDRDRAADSDDSLARKRQRLSEEAEVRIEADEPEDMGDGLQNAIMIEDDAESDDYSCTFQVLNVNLNMSVLDELKKLQRVVTGDSMYSPVSLYLTRHPYCVAINRPLVCADSHCLQPFATPTYCSTSQTGSTSISKTLPTTGIIGKPSTSRTNNSLPKLQHSRMAYWTVMISSILLLLLP